MDTRSPLAIVEGSSTSIAASGRVEPGGHRLPRPHYPSRTIQRDPSPPGNRAAHPHPAADGHGNRDFHTNRNAVADEYPDANHNT